MGLGVLSQELRVEIATRQEAQKLYESLENFLFWNKKGVVVGVGGDKSLKNSKLEPKK